ncbi:MAG: oxaloacetate decarboxylase [Synergistetes bacterium]|nr:oxaloacetate decarboxylase [Synergistota bacterium]
MKKSTLLRKLLLERKALVVPGAHDVISAKLIEKHGFKALQVSGFGLSASLLGLPDMGFLSFFEVLTLTRNIVNAVNIPVMADADTGYGNAINAMRVTEEFIKIGAAGMNIEDQVFPKRCGHLEGKEIIPIEEMVLKIKACAKVRDKLDPDFVINARTDAIALGGIEEAIKRGNAYAEAGADIIFVEAPRNIEEVERVAKEIKAPISINLFDLAGGGKTPFIPLEKLRELGIARVSIPVGPLFAAIKGMENYLRLIQNGAPVDEIKSSIISFDDFKKLVNFYEYRNLEKTFLPSK